MFFLALSAGGGDPDGPGPGGVGEPACGGKGGQGGVRPRAGKGSQVGRNSACLLQTFLSFANGNCSPGLC